ncbi:MAG: hypothetical protein C3F13_14250 [Anaerolineales bacterium]|nr:MAG: hypothetical protein C3F13_14250 [Anaerolineales bacterium]
MTQVDTLGILEILDQHLGWYPLMELQDAYKLIYQAVLGPEHLIGSPEEFSRYLELEYASLQADAAQHLFEPIRADGSLFRLNLRAYKARELGLAGLVTPLMMTAQFIQGTQSELRLTWGSFTQLCLQGYVRHFEPEEVELLDWQLIEQDFPALHHSEAYRRLYQPAYRLVSAGLIPSLGMPDEA